MAYSPIEQAYIDGIVAAQFPDPEPQPEPVMLADSGQVKSDAGFGTIGPIKRNKAQEALGYVGELLTKAGVQLDKVGLDVPVLGRISLKDLTVGESGKVLEDMADGFYPVEGGGNFISGTKRVKPDAALELMNIAPTVGAAAKIGGKAAVKGVTKAVEATKGLPVGLSVKEVGQGVDELGFYSAAQKAVDSIQQPKGTGAQFLKQIEKTPGVKPDEIKWTGLDDFLNSKKTVTKQEVQDYIANNRVEIKEVTLGNPLTVDEQAEIKALRQKDKMTNADRVRFDALSSKEDSGNAPKFSKYTLPGGENYREVLLTMPRTGEVKAVSATSDGNVWDVKMADGKEISFPVNMANDKAEAFAYAQNQTGTNFKSSHFDESNILAHLRVNDRVDVDGKKVLFVEEVQSDWHQAGRKRGYAGDISKELEKINAERTALMDEKLRYEKLAEPYVNEGKDAPQDIVEGWTMAANKLQSLQMKQDRLSVGVPDAPFKTNWQELAMKRAIQMAAEGDYDRIAFTTGAQQAARYDLSKQVKMISAMPSEGGKYNIYIEGNDGDALFRNRNGFGDYGQKTVTPDEFEELVGKDVAKTIMQKADELNRGKVSKDQYKFYDSRPTDLTIGGEGMKGFYDNILPKFLDKYGKKWDTKTGMTEIPAFNARTGEKTAPVHFIEITPKMRESVVTEGQPLFAVGAGAGAGAAATKEENK